MSATTRGPVSDSEALETLCEIVDSSNERRIEVYENKTGIGRASFTEEDWEAMDLEERPNELPSMNDSAARKLFSFRIPTALLARVRTRAALEDRDMSSVIIESLGAYADAAPGTVFTMATYAPTPRRGGRGRS